MTRIYRYILPHDAGMAPCPADGLITLATCKPVIRRTANPGDWVLGFRAGTHNRGQLLWAGLVEQVVDHGDYERIHRGRPDAVYRKAADGSFRRLVPGYHPSDHEMRRDLSAPVLVFDRARSRYLDGQPVPLPVALTHLAASGRGDRVNGTQPDDVPRLETWLASLPPARIAGGRRSPRAGSCGSSPPRKRGC